MSEQDSLFTLDNAAHSGCPAVAGSPYSVPLGKRGPIEMHVGMVRLAVHAQCEPDGSWAARVPDLTEHCEVGSSREEAIQLALKAVSVASPHTETS